MRMKALKEGLDAKIANMETAAKRAAESGE